VAGNYVVNHSFLRTVVVSRELRQTLSLPANGTKRMNSVLYHVLLSYKHKILYIQYIGMDAAGMFSGGARKCACKFTLNPLKAREFRIEEYFSKYFFIINLRYISSFY
jgi:hypothetical protein